MFVFLFFEQPVRELANANDGAVTPTHYTAVNDAFLSHFLLDTTMTNEEPLPKKVGVFYCPRMVFIVRCVLEALVT